MTAQTRSETDKKDSTLEPAVPNKFSKKYEDKKKLQQLLDNAAVKFNSDPKEGLQYMYENGLMEEKVDDVVKFLKETVSLNKAQIGEYLGNEKPFAIKVMHQYIESLNFENLELDEAVRKLCSYFKLPGEGQKIDRIMQKFAERYCLQNENAFRQADDAYILAYSIIMLNVNLHNPNVKSRMTKEQFVKNTMLAITDTSLSTRIELTYDRIAANEIVLNDSNNKSISCANDSFSNTFSFLNGIYNQHYYQPGHDYLQQRKKIITTIQDEVTNVNSSVKHIKNRKDNMFYEPQPDDAEALQPMFSICWLASLATFSTLLEDSQASVFLNQLQSLATGHSKDVLSMKALSEQLVTLCLNGYRYGIKLASHLSMDVEAESYVNSLAGFTLLGTEKLMDQRNIEAIKTLIEIAKFNNMCTYTYILNL
ncbi:hypothetical protein RFI_12486, partial [Reticulomyxa filosa]